MAKDGFLRNQFYCKTGQICAPIKGQLMQNNISYLIISSTQMHVHVLRH